ncbi:hypothetical protein OS493_019324 [Desmophyllum pertusum]|uniref:SWIM-type domain-containing protein n=1 Tax=Desmophyllum pertusum TaxID=174260 RepID=A0A9X0A1L8_9CNID|nr:hypothetical protein OS493_019324 [Desmophyllum pertusum]
MSSHINGFPVYKRSKSGITSKEILDICIGGNVSDDKVCARVPAGITESGIFIVDLQAVCYKDLTVDDNGVYGSHSSPSEDFQVFFDDLGNISAVEKINKNDKETISEIQTTRSHFIVRKQYSWPGKDKNFRRLIAKVEHEEKFLQFAIVQYTVNMTSDEAKMLFANPENSRKRGRPSEPKLRTKPSVLWRMREMGSKSSAKQIINNIHREVGGVVSISSPSDIPKDRQQVYNQLRKVEGRKKSRSTGPAKSPDITKLLSLQQAGRFVRDVSLGARSKKNGEMRAAASTFAGTDTTIGWIKRFCCPGSTQAAVAGVDMTYKLGPFYLTTVTFPNPMFVYKNNVNKHPTTLAAVMTSVTKEKRDYEYFARSLKSEGIESLMYGTDGECALESGFESVYPIAESPAHNNIHLRCFDHAKGDILTKLKELKVCETERNKIQREILGSEFGGKRVKGLVDCENETEFEELYVNKEVHWPEEFKEWMATTKGRHRSMKTTLKLCMLKPTRIAAGLGNPPNKWDNQRTESLNNVIKEAAENQVTDQASIHETLESEVFQQQENEYVKAIYRMGEYRLAPEFEKFSVTPSVWTQKTPEQQREHVKKVFKAPANTSSSNQVTPSKRLSITFEDCEVTSVAARMLSQIWHEAEIILSYNKVIDLGGGVYCVTEFGNSVNVTVKGNSHNCKCRNFQSTAGLCSHVLAVADTMGTLAALLEKFNTKTNKASSILNANISKRAGEKPKEKKKRKGQNNVEQIPILEEIERPDNDIDCQKPLAFTEIWHNTNKFQVVFTKECTSKAQKCESCKVEFARGGVVCIPQDIAICHMERYFYPKKDANGKTTYEPTWKREIARFYCVKKECILRRHPYFWKGMVEVQDDVRQNLKEGHKKLLKEALHLSI